MRSKVVGTFALLSLLVFVAGCHHRAHGKKHGIGPGHGHHGPVVRYCCKTWSEPDAHGRRTGNDCDEILEGKTYSTGDCVTGHLRGTVRSCVSLAVVVKPGKQIPVGTTDRHRESADVLNCQSME